MILCCTACWDGDDLMARDIGHWMEGIGRNRITDRCIWVGIMSLQIRTPKDVESGGSYDILLC